MRADQPFETTWSAVITRADGTVEDLGVIAVSPPAPAPRRSLWESLGRIVKQ